MTKTIDLHNPATDGMARLLFVVTRCDPDDPAPPWDDLDEAEQEAWGCKWDVLRSQMEAEGWQPPKTYAQHRFRSAMDVPDSGRFRPLGDTKVFQRTGDVARVVAPVPNAVTYMLSSLDLDYGTRGYMAVSR